MLKAKLKYNVGSKPKDLAPVKYSKEDMRFIEKRAAKLSGQCQSKETSSHLPNVELSNRKLEDRK